MSANHAHHRFGRQVLEQMPPEAARTVRRFRRLYNLGLHGPDIFFYYSPLQKTSIGSLGKTYHRLTGQQFFSNLVLRMGDHPSEAAMAYLYGLLAHYALDSVVHPLVRELMDREKVGHVELEVEFDRWLLVREGEVSPQTCDLSGVFKVTAGELVTVAGFYPPAKASHVHQALANCRRSLKLLAMKNRKLLNWGIGFLPEKIRQQQMLTPANARCLHLNEEMYLRYCQALERFPRLLEQLQAHMAENAPLGEDFAPDFG